MIVHGRRMITQSNVESMIEWKGLSKKVCNCVTLTGLRKNWAGGTEVRWANTSWKELRGEERDQKRVEESQEDVHRNEGRWKEMTRGEKSLEELTSGFTICDKRSEAPEKSMEVCRCSYRKTLFLDPIALHFLNLETSATHLARVLLVVIVTTHNGYQGDAITHKSIIWCLGLSKTGGLEDPNIWLSWWGTW